MSNPYSPHLSQDLSIFHQSGLIDIQFANFGQDVVLEFCNSETGILIGYLVCHTVLQFEYIDPQFKQGHIPTRVQGFSHYVHHITVHQQEQYYCICLIPYVQLKIKCQYYDILLPNTKTSTETE